MGRLLALAFLALATALTGCTRIVYPDHSILGVLALDKGTFALPGGIILYHDPHWYDDPANWTKREPFYLQPPKGM